VNFAGPRGGANTGSALAGQLFAKAPLRIKHEVTVAIGIDERVGRSSTLQLTVFGPHAVKFAVIGQEDVARQALPNGEAAFEIVSDLRVAPVVDQVHTRIDVGARKEYDRKRPALILDLHRPSRRAHGVTWREVRGQCNATERHELTITYPAIHWTVRPIEDTVVNRFAFSAVFDESRVCRRDHDLSAGLSANERVRLDVIDVRVAREDELDVAIVKAQRFDVLAQPWHRCFEARVEQDVASRCRNQKLRNFVAAHVVDIVDDSVRRERSVPLLHVARDPRLAGAPSKDQEEKDQRAPRQGFVLATRLTGVGDESQLRSS